MAATRGTAAIPCPLCGSDDLSVLSRYGGLWNDRLTTVACRACGFVFRNPPWGPAEAAEFYRSVSRYYTEAYETDRLGAEFAPRYAQSDARRAHWMRGHLSPGSRVLDVGAGNGCLIAALQTEGLVAEGMELDEDAVADAARKGLPVKLVGFEDLAEPEGSFAAVAMMDVLEHCTDLRVFLRQARRLVPEGGWLFVEVPDITTLHMKPEYLFVPEHNWHFTAPTLRYLLAQEGWRVAEERPVPEPCDAANGHYVTARKAEVDADAFATDRSEHDRVIASLERARREVRLARSEQLRDLVTRLLGPGRGRVLYRGMIGRYVGLKKAVGLYRHETSRK